MNSRQHVLYVEKWSTDIDSFENVALNENLSKTDLRVFMMLCCRVSSCRVHKIDADRLAETLGLKKKEFNKALENLIDEGIIAKESDEHVKKGYRMIYTEKYKL